MSINQQKKNTITTYVCGGAGINLGYSLACSSLLGDTNDIYSDLNIRYIDTSVQNFLGKDIDIDKQAYIFEAKGAGQIRNSVYGLINATYLDVFRKFPPSDINLIISSASGGSGNVIASVLASHLLKAGRPVILFMVGSVDTYRHAENTKATIATLQGISNKLGKPVILNYNENVPGSVEDVINNQVIFNVITTAILLSGAVDRIDSTDITNWLNYTRVCDQPASLTGFTISLGSDPINNLIQPFAALAIHRNEAVVPRDDSLDFKKIGFLDNIPGHTESIHYYLDKPSIQETFDRINKQCKKLKEISDARKATFNFSEKEDDNGFVF